MKFPIKIVALSLFLCANPLVAAQKTPTERMAAMKKIKSRGNGKLGCWDRGMNTCLIIFACVWVVGTTCAIMDRFATQKAKVQGDGAPILQRTSHLIQNADLGQNLPVPNLSYAQNSATTALHAHSLHKKKKD